MLIRSARAKGSDRANADKEREGRRNSKASAESASTF
jgi:hypothetical protein